MKNVKKLLTEHKSEILPDESVKHNIKRELGFDDKQASFAYAHGGEQTADIQRRNKFVVLCAAVAVAILILGILIPLLNNKGGNPIKPPLGNKFAQITDADSFYAYGAASVGTLLSSSDVASPVAAPASGITVRPTVKNTTSSVGKDLTAAPDSDGLSTVNRYMPLIESLLSEKAIESKAIAGEYGYPFGMTVSHTDLRGNTISYKLFYDKVFLTQKTNEEKTQESYSIQGILLIENAEYPVTGTYSAETESDESESEFYFRAFTNAAETSYIETRRETEAETEDGNVEVEQKYVYSVYNNGVLSECTEIEYESEKGQLELKISVTKGETTETLFFVDKIYGDERFIYAHGTVDGQSVKFRVYVMQGSYHYVFEDGSSSDLERDDNDDDDEDDDDLRQA